MDKNEFKLELMLAVYTREHEKQQGEYSPEENFYLETHQVYEQDGKQRLLEGRPLTKDHLGRLVDLFKARKKEKVEHDLLGGLIPTNLLYVNMEEGAHRIVWHTPAQKRLMSFAKGAGISSGEFHYPRLVWVAENRSEISVYAVKDEPSDITPLHYAPTFNVYQDGHVCIGSASLKRVDGAKTFKAYMEAWEDFYFNSKFSHGVATFKEITKKPLAPLLREQIASGKQFPLGMLAPVIEDEVEATTVGGLCTI